MKFGFIGTGHMGGALAKAVAKTDNALYLANHTAAKAQALADQIGGTVTDNEAVCRDCDYIFLGVKPQMMADTLRPLQEVLKARKTPFVLVSMAAGLTVSAIQTMAGGAYPTVRIMPNVACAVGESMTLYCYSDNVTKPQLTGLLDGLSRSGELEQLSEHLMDAGSAVAGCGGAFACLFMEALADGGVSIGLPRDKAMRFARQMLLGTAKLAAETGDHPGAIKDSICSPGGTTIAGVRVLERGGFRSAAMEAVIAAYEKTQELKQ